MSAFNLYHFRRLPSWRGPIIFYGAGHMNIADGLIETADQCSEIAKQRQLLVERLNAVIGPTTLTPLSQLSDGGLDLSERVERIAQSLLAKAVEIDHEQQKKGLSPS
jgi:hypothetical protein